MARFIRLDMKGTWKGVEHRSCVAGSVLVDAEEDVKWENGISCYSLDNSVDAFEQLHKYWFRIASITEEDLQNMQVTIFEGEGVGCGSDWETLATCKKTLKEFDALDFMMAIDKAKEDLNFEDITKEEYASEIARLADMC